MEKNKNYFYRLAKEDDKFKCIPFDINDKNHYKYTYYIKWQDHQQDIEDNTEFVLDTYVSDVMTDLNWGSFNKGGYLISCSTYIWAMERTKDGQTYKVKWFQIDGKDSNNREVSAALPFPSDLDVYCFAKYFMEALDLIEKYKDLEKVTDIFVKLYKPVDSYNDA